MKTAKKIDQFFKDERALAHIIHAVGYGSVASNRNEHVSGIAAERKQVCEKFLQLLEEYKQGK